MPPLRRRATLARINDVVPQIMPSAVSANPSSAIRSSDFRREIRDFDCRQERWRVIPRAALVGLLAGFVASGFRLLLEPLDRARDSQFAAAHRKPWGLLLVLMICGAASGTSAWTAQSRFSGIGAASWSG